MFCRYRTGQVISLNQYPQNGLIVQRENIKLLGAFFKQEHQLFYTSLS